MRERATPARFDSIKVLTIEPTILSPSGLDLAVLDPDAVRAVERLQSRDYEAYLVGGCVRDLLLGRAPKDYDIATEARPQQVKRVFPRNCRIIGRRFKLAHLHFHQNQKILEAATFRRTPQEENGSEDEDDLLITRDNEFGTAEEDALRRDFTMNALFLDPQEDQILDYAGGLPDLQDRVIRTIGDAEVRFREDPVRILRAAKFAGRLGFRIAGDTLQAMAKTAPDLTRAAPPRLLEEILRLLRGGHAVESFQLLRDIGALSVMLPVVADFLDGASPADRAQFWRGIEALDDLVLEGVAPSSAVMLGTVFAAPIRELTSRSKGRSPTTIVERVLGPFCLDLRLPKRDAGCLKRICGVQHRFDPNGSKRFRPEAFVNTEFFPEALELCDLLWQAAGRDTAQLDVWRDRFHAIAGNGEDGAVVMADATGAPAPVVAYRRRAAKEGRRSEKARDEGASKRDKKDRKRDKKDRKREDRRRRKGHTDVQTAPPRSNKVDTIEPEPMDLSAFDVELDPRRVPTFGTIVEGSGKKKRKRRGARHGLVDADLDDYRPPPADGDSDAPPPPAAPPADDTFGDW